MKLILLLLLILSTTADAQDRRRGMMRAPAAGGSGLLIDENFEGTGTPSGFTVLEASGLDFDNTSSPLTGAQDCLMGLVGSPDWQVSFTASAETWITFTFKKDGNPSTGITFFYGIAGAQYMGIIMNSDDTIRLSQTGAGVGSSTVDTVADATKIYFFLHVAKGSGANAVYDVEFNTSNSRTGSGNKFTSYTSGTITSNFDKGEGYKDVGAWVGSVWQLDDLKISNTGWPP